MLDAIGVKLRRDGIVAAFENIEKLKALRAQQEKLLTDLKYALSHSYIWPEAYAEKPTPTVAFSGGGTDSTYVLVMTSEPLQETRKIRFRVSYAMSARHKQGSLDPMKIRILDEEYQFIPMDIFKIVVGPYIKNIRSW